MIQAQDLSKSYESSPVIKNINLELKQGSIFGLIGANGAGKTTLIKTTDEIDQLFGSDKAEKLSPYLSIVRYKDIWAPYQKYKRRS